MKNRILITSALPYVNGIPHLGHLAGCLLPSDIYARVMRLLGYEVCYIGGTDEHGTPSEIGAKKEGMAVSDYTFKYHNLHREIYNQFGLSFDFFGRTSSIANHKMTAEIAVMLYKNGYIEEREIEALFSVVDDMFLPDRYVLGICPYCKADNARGDQCEACSHVLDPMELIEPRSAISGSKDLEWRKTSHLYLLLSKLEVKVADWVAGKDWNKLTKGIANKWLKEGLNDRCITRDLKWGIPVPSDIPNMEGKVFYVWFDAPIGYISMTQEYKGDGWKSWWFKSHGAEDVKYVEFMGKDNVPFHSITFPAQLLGADEDFKTVDIIKGLSFLNFNGGKFSKSAGRGIFANDAIAEFGVDYWRYWLIKNSPETDDVDFTFERFADDINKDLNDVLGNFILRVLKFYKSKFGDVILQNSVKDPVFMKKFDELKFEYIENLKSLEFRRALELLRKIWVMGNEYLDELAPWSLYKTNPDEAGSVLVFMIEYMVMILKLSLPIIPEVAERILKNLGQSVDFNFDIEVSKFEVPDMVFQKITPERVEELNLRYNK